MSCELHASSRAADALLEAIDSDEVDVDKYAGRTDCPHGCHVESDGVCPHGYESAALTLGVI